MAKLTVLLSVIHVLPLGLVWLLPDTREEQRRLCESREQSAFAGGILLTTILSSIAFVVVVDVTLAFIF